MANSRTRSSVSVEVEETELVHHVEPTWRAEREVATKAYVKPELSGRWELLVGGVLALVGITLLRSWSVLWKQSEIGLSLILLAIAIVVAGMSGRFAGKESSARKLIGWTLLGVGLLGSLIALIVGPLPGSTWFLAPALACTLIGWGIRRMVGDSFLRSLSLGLLCLIPFVFLAGGLLPSASLESVRRLIDQTTFWYIGVLADVNYIPHTPIENGVEFISGKLESSGAFDNYAGLLVALVFSLAVSMVAGHSLLIAGSSLLFAFIWWMVFRAITCLSLASQEQFETVYNLQAMSLWWLLTLFLAILGTNLGLGAIFAPIPLHANQYDLSPLTVIYNALVSLPQLGPASTSMSSQTASVEANHHPHAEEIPPDEDV